MIIFDIETNALKIDEVTEIHCCAINDGEETILYKDPKEWLPILENADTIIGHNIISYDIAVIKKIYPTFKPQGKPIDTLVLSRMFYPDLIDIDFRKKWENMPIQLYGRHSLEAYGHRLSLNKKHADLKDFSQLTQELMDRCVCDVRVTAKLWRRLQPKVDAYRKAVET